MIGSGGGHGQRQVETLENEGEHSFQGLAMEGWSGCHRRLSRVGRVSHCRIKYITTRVFPLFICCIVPTKSVRNVRKEFNVSIPCTLIQALPFLSSFFPFHLHLLCRVAGRQRVAGDSSGHWCRLVGVSFKLKFKGYRKGNHMMLINSCGVSWTATSNKVHKPDITENTYNLAGAWLSKPVTMDFVHFCQWRQETQVSHSVELFCGCFLCWCDETVAIKELVRCTRWSDIPLPLLPLPVTL